MPPYEYLTPEPLDLGTLAAAVAPALTVAAEGPAATEHVAFYDSFDARLRAAGLTLAVADGRTMLLDAEERERAGGALPGAAEVIRVGEIPAGPLRDTLAPLLDVRALLRRATIRREVRRARVLDAERKTVVRLALEEPRLDGGDSLEPRVRVVPVRGYDAQLARVVRALERDLALRPAALALSDEAVRRTGGTPEGIASKPTVELAPGERADVAAARILRALLDIARANLPGTLDDVDPEFLHDLRVSVRRSRALQRELKRVFAAEPLARFRGEFRHLQAVTGPSRDLDVYVLDFDEFREALPIEQRDDLEPLRALLLRRRAAELQLMREALRSRRVSDLLADWESFLADVESGRGDRVGEVPTIAAAAAGRIARVYTRMVKAGRAIDDASPPEALHELRKQGKELRYLLEFFAPLFDADIVKPMVRTLKALQDVLGRFQDREVQADLLRALADDVGAAPGGGAALMAMGRLVERLEVQQLAARAEFAERFAAFAAREQRALVRETFR